MIEYEVSNVSVVILAQQHNPAIINPDFLKNNGIVKKGWEVDNNPPVLSTPGLSLMSFKNGILWQVLPDRCEITEKVGGNFKKSYLVHECAKKYIETLKHIPYTALGMNWSLSLNLREKEFQDWFKARFLKPGDWQNTIEWINFAFKVIASSPQCNFTLHFQNRTIDCNFHIDISEKDKVKKMCSSLDDFGKNQEFLKQSLAKYFLEDL